MVLFLMHWLISCTALSQVQSHTGSLQPNSVGIALSNIQDTQQWVMFSDNPPPPGAVPTCTKLQWLLK